ncbi:hypothetical protein ISS39_03335 [Candidatus Bathyarchaeota archaeon]|nr:hypothetical protein [Candidatus Bathyarchaeota archaeon]
MKNMDLFERHPGKMMEIIQLLFREFEESMEFLALENDEISGRLPAVERLVRVLYPPKNPR